MPIPTLLKKAAGSIKRDRKDVRAVMTVNESEVPANNAISAQKLSALHDEIYKKTLNFEMNWRDANRDRNSEKIKELEEDLSKYLKDKYIKYADELEKNQNEKYKLTEDYAKKLEDEYVNGYLKYYNRNTAIADERNAILAKITNFGEKTKKLPLNEKFNKILNRVEGLPFFDSGQSNEIERLYNALKSNFLNEKEKEKFANYLFNNIQNAKQNVIRQIYNHGVKPEIGDYSSFLPKSLVYKMAGAIRSEEVITSEALEFYRLRLFDKKGKLHSGGKDNALNLIDRIYQKNPILNEFSYNNGKMNGIRNIEDYVEKTSDKSKILSNVYKVDKISRNVVDKEWKSYKKKSKLREYDELSDAEKNALRSND